MDFTTLPPFIATAIVAGLVFASLVSIAGFAHICINIWFKLKRRPSIDETLKDIPSKHDLKATEDRLRADIDEVDQRCTDEIRRMRSYNSRTSSEIFDLIRSEHDKYEESLKTFSNATNRELNTLSKEVGKLTGHLESQQKSKP